MKKKNLLLTTIAIFGLATLTMAQVPSYVPTSGLIGWWPFNGNANDESGNGNHGTVNGATLTTDRYGNSNKAYNFNGISPNGNNINVNYNFFNTGLNAFTISTWSNSNILDNTANGGAVQDIIHTNNAAGLGIGCNWGGSNKYSLWAMSNPPAGWDILYNQSSVSSFVINQWKHIVMIKNNTTYYIYLDGVLDNTFTTSITAQSYLTGLKFGTYWDGYEAFNGKLDDFAVWNRALTQTEITALFNGTAIGVEEELNKQSIIIYPNPTSTQININTDSKLVGSTYIIYDNIGKIVLTGKIQSEKLVVELGNLSDGIYLFSIGENLKQTFKIIKQ